VPLKVLLTPSDKGYNINVKNYTQIFRVCGIALSLAMVFSQFVM
jgi:hypothetical protein